MAFDAWYAEVEVLKQAAEFVLSLSVIVLKYLSSGEGWWSLQSWLTRKMAQCREVGGVVHSYCHQINEFWGFCLFVGFLVLREIICSVKSEIWKVSVCVEFVPQFPPGVFVFVCNFKFIDTYFLSSSSLSLSSSGTLEITHCETETEPALGSLAAALECVGHNSSAVQDSLTPTV